MTPKTSLETVPALGSQELRLEHWGVLDFPGADKRQDHYASLGQDILGIVQHPPTVTCGLRGNSSDLYVSQRELAEKGVDWSRVRRGGQLTYHGPGQFIAYPVLSLRKLGLRPRDYIRRLSAAGVQALQDVGVPASEGTGAPGFYLGPVKIGSIGVGLRGGTTRYGLAFNLDVPRSMIGLLRWCGLSPDHVGSLAQLGYPVSPVALTAAFHKRLGENLFMNAESSSKPHDFFPPWIRRSLSVGALRTEEVRKTVKTHGLATICAEARCPNASDCFRRGHVSFLVLGVTCTRGCPFCAVSKGKPQEPDPTEPLRLARAVKKLGLSRAVITMVDRDDLRDGGESHMVACVEEVRKYSPGTQIEVLTGDFRGCGQAPQRLVKAGLDCYSHNMETVPRLYKQVRPGANYGKSLELLEKVRSLDPSLDTKSALMVGLGEHFDEVRAVMRDLRSVGCRRLVVGQYLSPRQEGPLNRPRVAYLGLEFFRRIKQTGLEMGFDHVEAGPWARSSSHA